MTTQKIRQYLTLTCTTSVLKLLFPNKGARNKHLKNVIVMQPRPTQNLYQCAKFGDDRTSFNVKSVSHAKV